MTIDSNGHTVSSGKNGRPGKYQKWLEPENLILLEGWAREGLGYEDIANNIGISRDTLNEWKKRFPDISDALKKGREVSDYIVENELFQSCKTRKVMVRKPIKIKESAMDGRKRVEKERIEYVEEEVVVPGSVPAQIFWLRNRKSDKWSNSPENNVGHESAVEDWISGLMEGEDNDGKDEG